MVDRLSKFSLTRTGNTCGLSIWSRSGGRGGGVVVDKNFTFSIQNSWVAKSLMNHTFALKIEINTRHTKCI